jgi:methylenetetrahydrofolate reductase (NADPH)
MLNTFAADLAVSEILDFASLTDNPCGNPMNAPDFLGHLIMDKGLNVNIHLSCKDINRNPLETRAWHLTSEGFRNILALAGDYPINGYKGIARPIFDIDSTGLISMLSDINNGLDIPTAKKNTAAKLTRIDFFVSAAVSSFEKYEAEYMPQYFKMEKRSRPGPIISFRSWAIIPASGQRCCVMRRKIQSQSSF